MTPIWSRLEPFEALCGTVIAGPMIEGHNFADKAFWFTVRIFGFGKPSTSCVAGKLSTRRGQSPTWEASGSGVL